MAPKVVGGAQVGIGSSFLDPVAQLLGYPQVFHVTLDGRVKVAHGQVDGPDVAHLAGFGQSLAQLLDQLQALLVTGQGVRVVADGRVNVT
jgi:hypothetical protein